MDEQEPELLTGSPPCGKASARNSAELGNAERDAGHLAATLGPVGKRLLVARRSRGPVGPTPCGSVDRGATQDAGTRIAKPNA